MEVRLRDETALHNATRSRLVMNRPTAGLINPANLHNAARLLILPPSSRLSQPNSGLRNDTSSRRLLQFPNEHPSGSGKPGGAGWRPHQVS